MKTLFFITFIFSIFTISSRADTLTENNEIIYSMLLNIDAKEIESKLNELLKLQGYRFHKSTRKIYEMYFDTPELSFFNNDFILKYRAKEYVSKKNKLKYNESVELITQEAHSFYSVKHYRNTITYGGKHPLTGMVKRKERSSFFENLKSNGIVYPLRIKMIFSASANGSLYTIDKGNGTSVIVCIESVKAIFQKDSFSLNILKMYQPESYSNSLDFNAFITELEKVYGSSFGTENDYKLISQEIEKRVQFMYIMIKYPFLKVLFSLAIFLFTGVLLIKIFFWRRMFSSQSSIVPSKCFNSQKVK